MPYLPDGGRARVNCDNAAINVPVTVLDKTGAAVPGATLTLDYTSAAASDSINDVVLTDGRGIGLVTDQAGPGIVRVQGKLNDLSSDIAEISFIGTDCSTSVSPRSLTLQLR